MKNIIKLLNIILIFICINNCSAQSYYRPDPDADKFAGIWKWGDTTNGLTLIMKKENNVKILGNNDNTIMDLLIGFYKLYKNGQLKEDTTMYSNTNFADKKRGFIGTTETGTSINNPDQLRVLMSHKNKSIEVVVVYLDATHIKITKVRNTEGVRVILPGQSPTDWSIDIPENIILTKQ